MGRTFSVQKVLNNNVLIANNQEEKEVVLIGKGVGFGKKAGSELEDGEFEKLFVLQDEKEQTSYMQMLDHIDEELVAVMNDVIYMIAEQMGQPLNEHIHIGLTDHLAFAMKRLEQGLDIKNPFAVETKFIYPKEYKVASEAVTLLNNRLGIQLPEGEVGFIALHIHSACINQPVGELSQYTRLIAMMFKVIEDSLNITVDRESIHYIRLVRHIRFTIDRVKQGEQVREPEKILNLLKTEYPLCYNTAWKLVKILQQTLRRPVQEAEAVYLTLHLYRLTNKI
ncbi:glucose PTS transporter transcription antiterminator GlcT [Terribacillus sp. DMT04]|uniref:glucose PTS transporter transcription antiterminator GlcT n=1 Tax=Terribacillus sp. DMT04 TaxID=2850441 RepID=UPI001C2BF0AC|nr:transcription antiterminator [Terribacillus sp. DMT04]QXE02060.1 transcription antiterminator [Terribacillus sp. DMT04]